VALRVRCRCGKSIQVPTALAGKRVLCPGCKRPFSIPLEQFKRFAARKAAASGKEENPLASQEPPTEAAAPCPVELDIVPAEIALSAANVPTLESSEPSGVIPTAHPGAASRSGKLGLTCTLCRKTLAPGAVVCQDCGFNVATGAYVKDSRPPVAAAVTSASTTSYASDKPWLAGSKPGLLDSDVIQGPKRSFWFDAFAAFGYPFMSFGNGITFAIAAFIYLLEIVLQFVGCLGLIGIFFIEGWLAAMYLSVIQDTATGSPDLPGIKMEDGPLEDIIKPFFKYLGAFAVAFLPAAAYIMLISFNLLPASMASTLNLMLLMAAAIFFWPVFLLLFSFNALDMIVRVDLIFTTVFRTFLPFLALWLMLLLVGFIKLLPVMGMLIAMIGLNIPIPSLPTFGGFTGAAFFDVVDLYLGIVSMRLIGLYYLHFKRRFTLVME